MLDIGKLSYDIDGVVTYYADKAASCSVEGYYLESGEPPGCWVGSLRDHLGISGEVQPQAFRYLLEGRHPLTGEALSAQAKKADRAASRHDDVEPDRGKSTTRLRDDQALTTREVAVVLNVTERQVRRLLAAGDHLNNGLNSRLNASRSKPSHLNGTQVDLNGRRTWQVSGAELNRYRNERSGARRRPGYDLTLRPPKSVSVLWALSGPQRASQIRQAHLDAVQVVVDYYEDQAIFARRKEKDGSHTLVATKGIIAASFEHGTSRAGDPLLHNHVVTMNLTLAVDGEWRALEGGALYDHAKTAGFLYQAQLRHSLGQSLGLKFHPVEQGYADVEGVPEEVTRTFAKRRDEIERAVSEAGMGSAKAHQVATLATRKAKGSPRSPEDLIAGWKQEAARVGFRDQEVEACYGREVSLVVDDVDIAKTFEQLAGPQGVTRHASTFRRSDVIQALAVEVEASIDARELRDLAERFCTEVGEVIGVAQLDDIVEVEGRDVEQAPGLARFTVAELREKEREVLQWAKTGSSHSAPHATTNVLQRALATHDELSPEQIDMVKGVTMSNRSVATHDELSPEQIDMVKGVTMSNRSVRVVAGRPGSGKTYAASVCVEVFARTGANVIGCALSAEAASDLEASTRLRERTGRPATTLAALLMELGDEEEGGFAPGTVVFVDEASMVGTRDFHDLATHVARSGGAMVLIGDPDQHGSIETGGVFAHLVKDDKVTVLHLHQNNRQANASERLAIAEYRQGKVIEALSRYDHDDKVVRSRSVMESYDAMAADWFVGWKHGLVEPMLAGPNVMRRALNERARMLLRAEGELTGEAMVVAGREFEVGDWVVARKNDRCLRGVTKHDFVRNGSTGRVVSLDADARTAIVDFKELGTMTLPAAFLEEGNLDHAYARTTYGTQGKTMSKGLYHPSDLSSFEEGYVAITRAKDETRIYIVDAELPEDEEIDTKGWEVQMTNLEIVTDALEKRRAKLLVHDVDVDLRPSQEGDGHDAVPEMW